MNTAIINNSISTLRYDEKKLISDGYHTFGELYEHRIHLYIALCNLLSDLGWNIIKSKKHYDGSTWDGWFILQINSGDQISYHIPIHYWDKVRCKTNNKANKRDGHTSQDVLNRLLELIK